MLVLCLMLLETYCAQYYAGIIGLGLSIVTWLYMYSSFRTFCKTKCIYIYDITISFNRHPDPRSRPQFGQITRLLSCNSGYLLGWSDEDKQNGGKGAMKLGAPLESAINLYRDLQLMYK